MTASARPGEGAPHEHEGEHEVGGGHADAVQDREHVVERRARMSGRIDPGRDGHGPGEHEREQRERDREGQPLADQLGVGPLVLEREPEVAAHEVLQIG